MTDYLGQLDDDDLVMFVVEHLKDQKPPTSIVQGLEPVSNCAIPLFYASPALDWWLVYH